MMVVVAFFERISRHRLVREAKELVQAHRSKLPYVVGGVLVLLIYGLSHLRDQAVYVYHTEKAPEFKDSRMLGFQGDAIYEGKEKLLSKTVRELLAAQAGIRESSEKLRAKVEQLEKERTQSTPQASPTPTPTITPEPKTDQDIRISSSAENLKATHVDSNGGYSSRRGAFRGGVSEIISFPVKEVASEHTESIVLPAGSYVKAKLMTGVEAPEGKTYPALLQLDFAYIVPNKHRVDLSGCFMIAKSQGNLSTERVEMQVDKLSCVSKEGRMFEREVNGWVSDDKDNSFALIGSVNSKQDRVAAMAFLSSIVEGVGKAIQQSQSTQQTTPLGGSQMAVTGSQSEYMAAGGAANAAAMVTQWYLKQAQNLLPTINVGSGQDIWVVMKDTVKLPKDYFRKNSKGEASESIYTYLSRIVE